jgi:hypothetical protein
MTEQPDIEPLARQLMEQAQVLAQVRHDLDQLASETTDTYADLLARLEDRERQSTETPVPTTYCWRNLSSEEQTELWQQLSDWVNWLRGRYPLARTLPACWADHPEVVEELTALWLAWRAAYEASDAIPTAPVDWHDRWLPGLLIRLARGPLALPCRPDHEERPASAYATT